MGQISMGAVWDRATEFIGDNLSAIFPFAMLILITSVLEVIGTATIAVSDPSTAAIIRLGVLALVLAALFGRIAITAMAVDEDAGGGAATVSSRAVGRYLPVIGVRLITLAGAVVLALPAILILINAGISLAEMSDLKAETINTLPPATRLALGGYGLVAGLFALWLYVRLVLAMAAAVAGGGVISAIRRSFALTRGMMWKILGVIILLGIVSFVSTKAAQLVFGSVFGLLADTSGPLAIGSVLTSTAIALAGTIFVVLTDAFFAKLYLAARNAETGAAPE